MPTRFTSVGIKNTLVVAGATTLATVIATTITLTTLNATTANIVTVSGATINALQADGIVNARTISGSNIAATQPNGVVEGVTVSGTTVRTTSNLWNVTNLGVESVATVSGTTSIKIRSASQSKTLCKGSGNSIGVCSTVVNAIGGCVCTAF